MQSLMMQNAVYKQILRDISGGVIFIEDGKITYVNPAALAILDKRADELEDVFFAEAFFEYLENDDFNQVVLDAIYDPQNKHESILEYFNGSRKRYLYLKTSPLKDDEKFGIVILLDDITELISLQGDMLDLKDLNRQLEEKSKELELSRDQFKREAEVDALTGLYNKVKMEVLCRRYLSDFDSRWLAALFVIDLDNFKEANDTHGHQFGDLVLQQFAESLRSVFRSTDHIGRLSGDEFVVLMKDVPSEEIVRQKAREILQAAQEISIDGKDLDITASIGIALISEKIGYNSIFELADDSLYIVKSKGRNGFSINSSEKES